MFTASLSTTVAFIFFFLYTRLIIFTRLKIFADYFRRSRSSRESWIFRIKCSADNSHMPEVLSIVKQKTTIYLATHHLVTKPQPQKLHSFITANALGCCGKATTAI